MTAFRGVTAGLRFPEGPVAMPDGSVLVVEIERRTVTRVAPDGTKTVVAEPGGGPNGLAIGPEGKCYVCNNGGFDWHERNGRLMPGLQPKDYKGGAIHCGRCGTCVERREAFQQAGLVDPTEYESRPPLPAGPGKISAL